MHKRGSESLDACLQGLEDPDAVGEDYNVDEEDDGPRPFTALLDTGLKRTSTGSKVFAALKVRRLLVLTSLRLWYPVNCLLPLHATAPPFCSSCALSWHAGAPNAAAYREVSRVRMGRQLPMLIACPLPTRMHARTWNAHTHNLDL